MTVSEKIWREYLEACGYEAEDLVMKVGKRTTYPQLMRCGAGFDAADMARDCYEYSDTPLRIFTPDGRTQKGPDFETWIKGRKGKRSLLRDAISYSWAVEKHIDCLIDDIFKICGVDDGD
jgi:hypothetical protein